MIRKWLMMSLAVATYLSAFALSDIQCVADGTSGEYCGVGYGITVNVSTPASGYTVKYAESAEGPWVDELKYVNVCADRPIYYQVTAEGYTTATGSANVTVTPKTLTNDSIWLVFPSEDYVYDGTAKEPEVAAFDGEPSIITDDDWEVSFADNVNAGTATATFTGKGNYTGTCTEEFEITKADNSWTTEPAVADWTYGQTASTPVSAAQVGSATVTWSSGAVPTLPGSYTATFTVPESDNYNELTKTVNFKVLPATINLVADGASGEYCGVGYGITVNVSTPASGYTVKYAESADGPWVDELKYVDVCADRPIYYQVTAEGYTTATGSANVTVTPKTLTNDSIWLVFPSEDYVYDGTAKEPEVAAFDGEPSIITDDDWEVSFTDNVNAGTATATFTGKGNYTGTCTEEFEILGKPFVPGGEEPGEGDIPVGGTSKFDVVTMYDGEGHILDREAIGTAFAASSGGLSPEVAFARTESGPWAATSPVFTNVCSESIWYKVSAENFADFVHEARLMVTNRPVTLTSCSETFVYDGQAHSNTTVVATGFVDGESAAAGGFATITDVGEVSNAFSYVLMLRDGSIPANYLVAVSNGILTVLSNLKPLSVRCEWSDGTTKPTLVSVVVKTNNVDCQTISLSADADWTKTIELPALDAGGVVSWLVVPVDVPGVKMSVQAFGRKRFGTCLFSDQVWTRDGWKNLGNTPFTSEVYTLDGWVLLEKVNLSQYVATLDMSEGSFFAIMAENDVPQMAGLSVDLAWKLQKSTGTYFGQLQITCTNGLSAGISDLKFLFADRRDGSEVVASLWSTPQRAATPNTEVYGGVTYRVVTLSPTLLTAENSPVVFGVSNLSATSIPVAERTIEMYVRRRIDPTMGNESAAGVEDFVGYVAWTSNGETTMIPVVAGSAAKTLKKVSLMAAAPMSLGTINASLAVGVAVDETAKPYCRITSFAANDEKISGFVEVGATLGDVQKAGTLGDNARMSLYGATSLTGPFEKIGSARGAFSFPNTKGFRFFKAGLEIDEIIK